MKYIIPNKTGSALIITIMIVMILSITMIYLMEKIVPASKNVKWIENSTIAYYNGDTSVEQALLFLNSSTPWTESWVTKPASQPRGFNMQIIASWATLPGIWDWNSDFDKDWNRIWPGEPIQLAISNNITDWWQIKFYFKVPDMHNWATITLSWWVSLPVINWALSWSGKSIFASWSQITASGSDIYPSTSSWFVTLNTSIGENLDWSWWTLAEFYNWVTSFTPTTWLWTGWSDCSLYNCSLKLSIVNSLVSTNNEIIPYLEYRIDMWTNPSLPLQYAIIKADGYSYGYKKSLKKEKQQTTINEGFDFTVFQ